MINDAERTLDTLRLSPRQIETLLDELQQPRYTEAAAQANRESERFFYTDLSGVPLDIVHPGGSDARFSVIPTDLSASGMGLLHGGFLHRGTPVVATLTDLQGATRRIEGHVTQCLLHTGRVHRIGIVFVEPIELGDFLRQDEPGADNQGGELQGRVLHLDDSSEFQRIFSHHCEKAGVAVTEATTVASAVAAVGSTGIDVVYLDLHLGEGSGFDALEQLRGAGYDGPVVVLTGDESAAVAERARAAGVAQVLTKPVMPEVIRGSLSRYVKGQDTDESPVVSTMWAESALRPTIERMVAGLPDRVSTLAALIESNDDGWRALCRDLKSEVGGCGYGELSDLFRQIEGAAEASDPTVEPTLRSIDRMVERMESGIRSG